jgi:hypothetical protein
MVRRPAVMALVILAALPSCGVFDAPDFAGDVIEAAGPEQVLVRFDEDHPDLGLEAYVSLQSLSEDVKAQVDVGDHVQVWITGDTNDSAPPGVFATRLEVDEASDN